MGNQHMDSYQDFLQLVHLPPVEKKLNPRHLARRYRTWKQNNANHSFEHVLDRVEEDVSAFGNEVAHGEFRVWKWLNKIRTGEISNASQEEKEMLAMLLDHELLRYSEEEE